MPVRVDSSGIKRLQRKLQALNDELTTHVSLSELFPPSFVQAHSGYASFEALLEANNIQTVEDFEALSEDERDRLIREGTTFAGWDAILTAAGNELVQRKIKKAGLG